jgi:hypothetical protein
MQSPARPQRSVWQASAARSSFQSWHLYLVHRLALHWREKVVKGVMFAVRWLLDPSLGTAALS